MIPGYKERVRKYRRIAFQRRYYGDPEFRRRLLDRVAFNNRVRHLEWKTAVAANAPEADAAMDEAFERLMSKFRARWEQEEAFEWLVQLADAATTLAHAPLSEDPYRRERKDLPFTRALPYVRGVCDDCARRGVALKEFDKVRDGESDRWMYMLCPYCAEKHGLAW